MVDTSDGTDESKGIAPGQLVRSGSVLLAVVALLKVYGVSRYSLTDTTALVTASPLSVLTGLVALYGYVVLPIFAACTLVALFAHWHDHADTIWWRILLAVTVVSVLLSPVLYLWYALLIILAVPAEWVLGRLIRGPARRLWRRTVRSKAGRRPVARQLLRGIGTGLRQTRPFFRRGWLVAGIALALMASFFVRTIEAPWLPAQVFVLRKPVVVNPQSISDDSRVWQDEGKITGYLVSEDAGEAMILDDYTRVLVQIPSTEILGRHVCHGPQQLSPEKPLLWSLTHTEYDSRNLDCSKIMDLQFPEDAARAAGDVSPDPSVTRATNPPSATPAPSPSTAVGSLKIGMPTATPVPGEPHLQDITASLEGVPEGVSFFVATKYAEDVKVTLQGPCSVASTGASCRAAQLGNQDAAPGTPFVVQVIAVSRGGFKAFQALVDTQDKVEMTKLPAGVVAISPAALVRRP